MKQRIGHTGTLAEYTARVGRVIDALERDVKALRELWGDEPEPGTESAEQLDAAGPFTATEHLVNAHKVREHRRAEHSREYPEHGHCSICGACGKKSSTCLSVVNGTYYGRGSAHHTGEPFTGPGC